VRERDMTFEVQRPWHCLHSNHLVLTDTPTQLSQPHTKVDPSTYRPKRSKQPCSRRYANPALPAPNKGRPLFVPTKTILTTLLSQPEPVQRSTPTLTDQNHSNHVVLTETPDKLAQCPCKALPYIYRPTPLLTILFS